MLIHENALKFGASLQKAAKTLRFSDGTMKSSPMCCDSGPGDAQHPENDQETWPKFL